MAKKEFRFCGKSMDELKSMGINEFAQLLPARQRRSLIRRGLTDAQKKFVKKIDLGKNNVKTHCRDMIILPKMIGKTVRVYKGNAFMPVTIQEEMIGHYLGEFILTRRNVSHSAPGVGATRSSASVSVR